MPTIPFLPLMPRLEAWKDEPRDATFVDVHAEATSEKMAFGHYLDGRVTAVEGTHTHAPPLTRKSCPAGQPFRPIWA